MNRVCLIIIRQKRISIAVSVMWLSLNSVMYVQVKPFSEQIPIPVPMVLSYNFV